ncbi:unnamed protein product [Leptidea sinapis]|uniref:Major facilitator superfamily (MFS) profile domain-containing protein n=1 Tax=Leptidea sinapis TaxID=189913 RepID=A0A5E4QT03_9NEOP|nr:unnamed protein product [Leptidea sinapis]
MSCLERGKSTILFLVRPSSINLAVFAYGIENSWISPMTKSLQSDHSPAGEPLSDYQISWIASLLCIAAVFGAPVYSYIADRFGRKAAVMAILLPQAISSAMKLYPTIYMLTASRIIAGLSAGGIFNIIPMYVKEISHENLRGILGSILVMAQNLGVLVMYLLGGYLDYYTVQWSIIGIPILAAIVMIKAPEAPAFLVKKDKIEEAMQTVAFLRGLNKDDKRVQDEIDCMRKEEEEFKSLPNVELKDLFMDEKWRRGVIIILVASTVHACNGAYAIIVYAVTLLNKAGGEMEISTELQSVSFPIVMILACVLLALFVERFGRKPLLAGAYFISALSFASIATAILLKETGTYVAPAWFPLLTMIVCVFAYAGGVSSLLYIIMTEMFNFQIRAKVLGIVVTYIWLLESIQLLVYAPISNLFGFHTLFFIFAAINLLGFTFTCICTPETKGRSEEEIQRIIRGHVNKDC